MSEKLSNYAEMTREELERENIRLGNEIMKLKSSQRQLQFWIDKRYDEWVKSLGTSKNDQTIRI